MITLLKLQGGRKRRNSGPDSEQDTASPEEKKNRANRNFNKGLIISCIICGLLFYVFIFLLFTTPSHLASKDIPDFDHTSLIEGLAPRKSWGKTAKKAKKKPPHHHHRDFGDRKTMGEELVIVDNHPKLEDTILEAKEEVRENPKRFRHHRGHQYERKISK